MLLTVGLLSCSTNRLPYIRSSEKLIIKICLDPKLIKIDELS